MTEDLRAFVHFYGGIDDPLFNRYAKNVDLIAFQVPVEYGSYPETLWTCVPGYKYSDNLQAVDPWDDNPWSDRVEDPTGDFYDLYRFLDQYYFLDILAVSLRGEYLYDSDGNVELDAGGNKVFKFQEARLYKASSHVENNPTQFKIVVLDGDGELITDADVTIDFGEIETELTHDENDGYYSGQVFGIGDATITVEKEGFVDKVIPITLMNNGVIQEVNIRQENGYAKTYLEIVMEAESP